MPKILDFIRDFLNKDAAATALYQEADANLKAFVEGLQGPVRLYIPNAPNMGHQSSGIALLRWFLRRYPACKIEVYYSCEQRRGEASMEEKLMLLVEGFTGGASSVVTLEGVAVPFIRIPDIFSFQPLTAEADFGLTGGFDGNVEFNLAKLFKVKAFLVLQPFQWHVACRIQLPEDVGETIHPLSAYSMYAQANRSFMFTEGGDLFSEIPDFIDPIDFSPTPLQVEWYTNRISEPHIKEMTNLALLLEKKAPNHLLWPVYGLHTMTVNAYTIALFKLLITAIELSNLEKRPVTLVCLSSFVFSELRDSINALKAVCSGHLDTLIELTWAGNEGYAKEGAAWFKKCEEQAALQSLWTAFQKKDIKLPKYVFEQGELNLPTLEAILQISWPAVNLIFLDSLPGPIFRKVMSLADLPFIFEGQATAGAAISLGRPYFHINQINNPFNNYHIFSADKAVGDYLQMVATTSLLPFTSPRIAGMPKPGITEHNQIVAFVSFLQMCLRKEATEPVIRFFSTMQAEIQKPEHDRRKLALIIVKSVMEHLLEDSIRAGNESPLTLMEVKNRLESALPTESLSMDDCFPKSNFTSWFWQFAEKLVFFGEGMRLETEEREGRLSLVRLTGGKTEFCGIRFDACAEFTPYCDTGLIQTVITGTSEETWQFLPWVQLTQAGFWLGVPENGMPMQGYLTGRIEELDTTVYLNYPVQSGVWNLWAAFDKPYSAIAQIQRLAGNYGFMELLPPGLKTVAGIGVSRFGFLYEEATGTLQNIDVTLTTESEDGWVFFENPRLSVVPVAVVHVAEPTSMERRSVSVEIGGTMTIGSGTLSLYASYPDFCVKVNLTEGSIKWTELASLFCPEVTGPEGLAITALGMNLFPEKKKYEIYGAIETDWSIGSLFTITGLSAGISYEPGHSKVFFGGSMEFLPGVVPLFMTVSAGWEETKGWLIEGSLTNGESPDLSRIMKHYMGVNISADGDSPDIPLGELNLRLECATGRFSIEAKSQGLWDISSIIPGTKVKAEVYVGTLPPKEMDGPVYGKIGAGIVWGHTELDFWYDYYGEGGACFGISCTGLGTATLQKKSEEEGWVAKLVLDESVTLGSIVCRLIQWLTGREYGLEAPWNVLDKISLGGEGLEFHMKTGRTKVSLNLHDLDIGIATLSKINLCYEPDQANNGVKKGVFVTLEGKFLWMKEEEQKEPLSWDASKPGDAPAPDGKGTSYFDLRSLYLGQHLEIPGLKEAPNVMEAIRIMEETLPPMKEGAIPAISCNPDYGWMFGANFGILKEKGEANYMIDVKAVLNDPELYALRLALSGKSARVFAGLVVQILYRKVSDTVGVFETEVVLPDAMRYLSVGAYSLTLPIVGISIYTNGDFQVDFGFPWGGNFSRSLAIEAIIFPGIPFTGAAGIYFGKLSAETSVGRVPVTEKGLFNPVMVFGIGIRAGAGKSIHYGILQAGVSLTVSVILEGVLAKWNPYVPAAAEEEDYYFKLVGIASIDGRIFGSVDFAIIKAEVDIAVNLSIQFTFATYEPIVFVISAGLSVKLVLVINFGFKIRIHFSFSIHIREEFVIEQNGDAPWRSIAENERNRRMGAVYYRLGKERKNKEYELCWDRLMGEEKKQILQAYATAALTVKEHKGIPVSCIVLMLLLESGEKKDSSFEQLCRMIARWILAALQKNYITPGQADEIPVEEEALDWLLEQGLASTDARQTPISGETACEFLNGHFLIQIAIEPEEKNMTDGAVSGTYFPIPGALGLTAGEEGKETSYAFSAYNQVTEEKIRSLRSLFDQLAVKVNEPKPKKQAISHQDSTCSMSEWMFADYFLLLARQIVQELRSRMEQDRKENWEEESGRSVRLKELLEGMEADGFFTRLAGMTSRYHLYGMRIPTDGIIPLVKEVEMPKEAGLYELTGQQLDLPEILEKDYRITLDASAIPWMQFDKNEKNVFEMYIKKDDSTDRAKKLLLTAAKDTGLLPNPALTRRQAGEKKTAEYLMTGGFAMKLEMPIHLPYGEVASEEVTMYQVTEAMTAAGYPCSFDMYLAKWGEAGTDMVKIPADPYGWGMAIRFSVQKNQRAEGMYELAGTDIEGQGCLMEYLLHPNIRASMLLFGCNANAAEALICGNADTVKAGFMKSNLSTEGHPSNSMLMQGEDGVIRQNLQTLWEGSVTGGAGYYLYYEDTKTHKGFPDAVFDDKGLAEVFLLVLFEKPETGLEACVNTFISGTEPEAGYLPLACSGDGREMLFLTGRTGVCSVGLKTKCQDGPEEIIDEASAKDYLRSQYSLISYRIAENAFFAPSPTGLPLAPSGETEWEFATSIPYSSFIKTKTLNPYDASGEEMLLGFFWQDIYGNRLGINETMATVKMAYTDRLLALATWPGIGVSYGVTSREEGGLSIKINMTFDTEKYEKNKDSAQADLQTYRDLFYQMTDKNGWSCRLKTSLLKPDICPELEKEQMLKWLFGKEESVVAFLAERVKGQTGQKPGTLLLSCLCERNQVSEDQFYQILCEAVVSRNGGEAAAELKEVPEIMNTASFISPLGSEAEFAVMLKEVLPEYYLLAGGRKKSEAERELWLIRLGENGVSCRFDELPFVCAVRPLSLVLMSEDKGIPLRSYMPGAGLSPEPVSVKQFHDVDTDRWLLTALEFFDRLLGPEGLKGMYQETCYYQLLELKKSLANALCRLLMPVRKETKDYETAAEALRQKLLTELGNLKKVKAVVTGRVTVEAKDWKGDVPRIYGTASLKQIQDEGVMEMEPAGWSLEGQTSPAFASGVMAPELLCRKDGSVVSCLAGSLMFRPTYLVHEMKHPFAGSEYESQVWLRFVEQMPEEEICSGLEVPLVLRNYPETPVMEWQKDTTENLSDLLKWNYSFAYSLPYHYPQDEITYYISFNKKTEKQRYGDCPKALFLALAQFMEVKDALWEDFCQYTSQPEAHQEQAPVVLQSAIELYEAISKAATGITLRTKARINEESLIFVIQEDVLFYNGNQCFAITLKQKEGMEWNQIPEVLIEPEEWECIPHTSGEQWKELTYIYKNRETGEYMTPLQGQEKKERQIRVSDLNLLLVQNAFAAVMVERNRHLTKEGETMPEFIYSTGKTAFGNPCYVSREVNTEILLKEYGTDAGIAARLEAFLEEMSLGDISVKLQAEAVYLRPYGESGRFIELPVWFQTPTGGNRQERKRLFEEWEKNLIDWRNTYLGRSDTKDGWSRGCRIRFDLMLFSAVTPEPRQLIRWENLLWEALET